MKPVREIPIEILPESPSSGEEEENWTNRMEWMLIIHWNHVRYKQKNFHFTGGDTGLEGFKNYSGIAVRWFAANRSLEKMSQRMYIH